MLITKNKRLIGILLAAVLLLLIPLVAMPFTNEVNWSFSDFIVAGGLLFGTGLFIEFVIRKVKNMNVRFILALVALAALILLWMELAVGIFGSPIAGS